MSPLLKESICFQGNSNLKNFAFSLPSNQLFYFNENCIKKETLKIIIEKIGIKTKTSNSIQEAIKYIADKDKDAIILIIGSIFLIGEVLNLN